MTREFSGVRMLLCLVAVSTVAASQSTVSSPLARDSDSGGGGTGARSAAHSISASFTCAGGKKIRAVFCTAARASVTLDLSDGRRLRLPQSLAAAGARYASPDENIVFWNKGRSAFIEEHGQRTFSGCVQSP